MANSIGCSDLASVLGCSPWTSRSLLWMRKKKLAPEQEASPRMEGGNFLERGVLEWYAKRRGARVIPNVYPEPFYVFLGASQDGKSEHANQWRYRSDFHPWLTGTPDALYFFNEGDPDSEAIVDAKMTGTPLTHWDPPPEHYRVQMVGYMLLTGLRRATLAVCFDGADLGWVDVAYDEALAARIVAEGAEFAKSLDADVCPYTIDADATRYVWPPSRASGAIVAPLSVNGRTQGQIDEEWCDASASIVEARARKKAADTEIRNIIAGNRKAIFTARGCEYTISRAGKLSRTKT